MSESRKKEKKEAALNVAKMEAKNAATKYGREMARIYELNYSTYSNKDCQKMIEDKLKASLNNFFDNEENSILNGKDTFEQRMIYGAFFQSLKRTFLDLKTAVKNDTPADKENRQLKSKNTYVLWGARYSEEEREAAIKAADDHFIGLVNKLKKERMKPIEKIEEKTKVYAATKQTPAKTNVAIKTAATNQEKPVNSSIMQNISNQLESVFKRLKRIEHHFKKITLSKNRNSIFSKTKTSAKVPNTPGPKKPGR